jgi:hypothetical protein
MSQSHTERSVDECSAPPSHPGDILLHPIGLELIFLPIGQEVVNGVQQPTLVAMDPQCDGLPGGVSNSITVRGPKSWSLVFAEDSGSEEDHYNSFELHPPLMWDFLDPVSRGDCDARVFQQSPKPTSGDQSFGPEELHLVRILVHHLVLGVTRGRVLFIGHVFKVMVLQLLLLLSGRALSHWALREHQLYHKRLLLL